MQNHPHVTIATYLTKQATQPADNPWFLQNWLRFSSRYPRCPPQDMHLMVFNKCDWHALGRRVGALVISVLKSYATGRIELSSADPRSPPRVRFNLIPDCRDEDRLISGVRFALELLADPHIAKYRHEVFIPNERLVSSLSQRTAYNRAKAWIIALVLERRSLRRLLFAKSAFDPEGLLSNPSDLRKFVRTYAGLQYHVSGTCRMGNAGDPEAVVDGAGRVHGMESLRVADASIFPSSPRGYTHFIVMMAAEKIADTVKAEWGGKSGLTEEHLARTAANSFQVGTEV